MPPALYRRWRPKTWQAVVGQDHVVETIRNAVKGDRIGHAYLFAGPRGTGKTTTARLVAKAANCLAPDPSDRPCNKCEHCLALNAGNFIDLIEIDAASNTSVEDVRDLRDRINFSPNKGRFKVYIVDEVHMLSTAAFNALLKTLEEPPAHAIFILATTEVHKIPATVLSRCQRHEFRRIPVEVIIAALEEIVAKEDMSLESGVAELIARQATGSLRDAISMLDLLTSTGETVSLEMARRVLGTATGEAVVDLIRALIDTDAATGLTIIHRALDAGTDPRQMARQLVEYLRALLMIQVGNEDLVERSMGITSDMTGLVEHIERSMLMRAIDSFSEAALGSHVDWQPGLGLEMALMECILDEGASNPGNGDHANPASRNPTAIHETAPKGVEQNRPGESREKVTARVANSNPPAIGLSFQQVVDHWPKILSAARSVDPQAQALLNSCKPLGLQDGNLVLGFASDILREKMEGGQNPAMVARIVEQVLGEPLGLRCTLTERWDPERGPSSGPPVPDGGMVATAMRDLGAQLAEVQPVERGEPSGGDQGEPDHE